MEQILIVEDDRALSAGIAAAFRNEQLAFIQSYNIKSAKCELREKKIDLVLLDINLPDGNGLDLLAYIKSEGNTPVILLTANDMETDVVSGLAMGADDYVTKPFSLAILRARVEVQLRKRGQETSYRRGGYLFDFEKQIFEHGGKRIELSRTEQRILYLLVKNSGHAVAREQLLAFVWNEGYAYVEENALSVAVNRLRSKMEHKSCIRTVYGVGYCWEVKES